MGTPDFACPALLDLINSEHEVMAVYTQPPKQANRGMKVIKSKIHQLADENSLNVQTPKSLKAIQEQEVFKSYNADIAVVAAYGLLLPTEILEGTKLGGINIHPSKLPRWRGAAPIQRTLMSGDQDTAICIMQMNEGLDTGDVLLRKDYKLSDDITAGELHDKLANDSGKMILETINLISQNRIEAKPQGKEGITYANKITKNDEKIDFSKSAKEVHNQIRGLSPYPCAYLTIDNKKYKIFKSRLNNKINAEKAGTIINDSFEISCKSGSISILEIQKEGKKRVPIEDFINGNKFPIGTKVNT